MIRKLGSLNLALSLVATTAFFVIIGTILESVFDSHAYAAEWTYNSPVFIGLLIFFFVNILAAALLRWPFKWRHAPFLMTHLGLLLMIGGTFVKSVWGLQGHIALTEGTGTNEVLIPGTYAVRIEDKVYPLSELPVPVKAFFTHHSIEYEGSPTEFILYDEGRAGIFREVNGEEVPIKLTRSPLPEKRKREDNLPMIVIDDLALSYDPHANQLRFPNKQGQLMRFQPAVALLDERIRLRHAEQINYPNTNAPYHYEARIYVDETPVTLSMNEVHELKDGTRLYLANIDAKPNRAKRVLFVVNRDPAKYYLTYPGGILVAIAGAWLLLGRKNVKIH